MRRARHRRSLNASYDQKRYRVTFVETVAPPPSSVLHAAIARAPATAMENVVTRYRRVMLGKFTADALCPRAWRPPCSPTGRLALPSAPAPPWSSSAIVRTSRSTSRSKSPRSACQSLRAANRPATRNERNISPCRALPRRLERRLQLLELTRTPKRAHQVERAVVLRRERDVANRLLVVSVWISRQGDRPADRAPDEALIVADAECACSRVRAPSRSSSHDRRGVRRCIALAS